jgi:hypothetical protein
MLKIIDPPDAQGTLLPEYVQRELDDFLKCGRLEHGFSARALHGLSPRTIGRIQP